MESQVFADRLSVKGRTVLDSVTRRSSEAYESRDLDDGEKQRQRDSVLAYILANSDEGGSIRFLSLPDERWSFERQLEHARPGLCDFTGLQWSWMTLERSVGWMPGCGRATRVVEPISVGELVGFAKDRSRIVHCHAGSVLGLSQQEIRQGYNGQAQKVRSRFSEKYKKRTAVWLDFTSQLCDEIRLSVDNIDRWVAIWKKRIPVIVSFMACRDSFRSDDARVVQLLTWFGKGSGRHFKVEQIWRHQSADTPFLSVVGYM